MIVTSEKINPNKRDDLFVLLELAKKGEEIQAIQQKHKLANKGMGIYDSFVCYAYKQKVVTQISFMITKNP